MKTKSTFLMCLMFFAYQASHAQWLSVDTIPDAQFGMDIEIVNSDVIWVLTTPTSSSTPNTNAHTLRSIDGGDTWEKHEIPETQSNLISAMGLYASDSLNAYALVYYKGVYKTTDGSKSWVQINNKVKYGCAIHFFNSNDGLILENKDTNFYFSPDDSTRILTTTDGGYNWKEIDMTALGGFLPMENFYNTPNNFFQTSGDTVCFITALGRIFMSYDKGNTWKVFHSGLGENQFLLAVAMKSAKSFAVVSYAQLLINDASVVVINNEYFTHTSVTDDGGLTWINNASINLDANTIAYIKGSNSKYILAAGNSTFLSDDNSKTFVNIDYQHIFHTFEFFSPEVGFAINSYNNSSNPEQIYKWTNTYSYLEITSPEIALSYQADTATLVINSNTEWEVESNKDWLSINKSGGSNRDSLTLFALENSTAIERNAIISLSAEGVNTKTIHVYQEGSPLFSIQKSESDFQVYLNRGSNIIMFSCPLDIQQNGTIQLFDCIGHQILTQTLLPLQQGETFSIDLNNQPAGIYLVRLKTGKEEFSGKVLLVK